MIRLMLIDDEEDALDLLCILMEPMKDIEIVGRYVSPTAALEDAKRLGVDAVILDIQMLGMHGIEVAREFRSLMPRIPIVFTTAYSEYAVEAFDIRSTDYLLKPFKPERLYEALNRIRQVIHSSVEPMPLEESADDLCIVQCLGDFYIHVASGSGGGVAWRTRKEKELCAYLLHQGGKPSSTAEIIEALWPMYDLDKAKSYLYTCMSYLKKTLQDHRLPIVIEKTGKKFVAHAKESDVDAALLMRLLNGAVSAGSLDTRVVERLDQLYQGDYMWKCDYHWATSRQLQIKSLYIRVLRIGYRQFYEQSNFASAMECLQRVLELAPESEPDGRELIQLYWKEGRRKDALYVAERLEEAVRTQLGADLEDETMELIKQLAEKSRSEAL